MRCSYCGKYLPDFAKYCDECGNRIRGQEEDFHSASQNVQSPQKISKELDNINLNKFGIKNVKRITYFPLELEKYAFKILKKFQAKIQSSSSENQQKEKPFCYVDENNKNKDAPSISEDIWNEIINLVGKSLSGKDIYILDHYFENIPTRLITDDLLIAFNTTCQKKITTNDNVRPSTFSPRTIVIVPSCISPSNNEDELEKSLIELLSIFAIGNNKENVLIYMNTEN